MAPDLDGAVDRPSASLRGPSRYPHASAAAARSTDAPLRAGTTGALRLDPEEKTWLPSPA
jgi:hypothetical protein